MATIKSYTNLEQSKKLAEILPVESADMSWIIVNYGDEAGSRHEPSLTTYKTGSFFRDRIFPKDHTIPCWSLAALLSLIPCSYRVYRHPYDDGLSLSLEISNCIEVTADNEMDACYKIILKLHDLNLL